MSADAAPTEHSEEPRTSTHQTATLLNSPESSSSAVEIEATPVQPSMTLSALNYRPDIDGLRALSVIAVLAYHLDHQYLPGGFSGVDIFFVISGYVVGGSLLRNQRTRSCAGFLSDFYLRRAKRLSPALVTTLLLSAISRAVLLKPSTNVATAGGAMHHYETALSTTV